MPLIHGFGCKIRVVSVMRGVHVAPFFFPVVPKGQARIRTQMNAALTRDDLDFALNAFTQAGKAIGVLK